MFKKALEGRKATALVAVVSAAALILSSCGNSDEPTEPVVEAKSIPAPVFEEGSTMDALQKAGRIRVGVKFDQPGFGLRDPDTDAIDGFDVEIAQLLAQRLFGGTKEEAAGRIDFVETVSLNRAPFLQDNKVDMVVATFTINETREQLVDFAGPYYVARGDIMVRDETDNIRSVTDLNGKSVCTARNSTYAETIDREAPLANVQPQATYSQCVDALRSEDVDAIATDNVILAGLAAANGDEFRLVGTTFSEDPYGVAIEEGEQEFQAFLSNALQEIIDEGDWATAYEETLGELGLEVPTPPEVDQPETEEAQGSSEQNSGEESQTSPEDTEAEQN
jgi:glutamate transport system substrate-binding protein